MPYLTESEVRAHAAQVTQRVHKSARQVLVEATAAANQKFDVFLSHSSAEPEELLLGIKVLLEVQGLSVYVDKYSDPHLSPDSVTRETASVLRRRMNCSNTLLYVYSQYSKKSRWMPWELGFFDGLKRTVGVVPVTRNQEETFKGEEYLNLYLYIDVATVKNSTERRLWINESTDTYAPLAQFIKGTEKITKRRS
jgi:hypothetical protein